MHIYERTSSGIETRHRMPYAKPRFNEDGDELFRDSTVADFKKMRKEGKPVAPSVTTILDIYEKPALTNWKIDQHLKTAYEDSEIAFQSKDVDEYLRRIKAKTKDLLDQTPKAGTKFHKQMEDRIKCVQMKKLHSGTTDAIENTLSAISNYTGSWAESWQTEVSIHNDDYAGQCDLYIPKMIEKGHMQSAWVIDYKTKETADKFKPGKMGYVDNHLPQLMAYAMALDPSARVANIFVCLETGEVDFHEWTNEQQKVQAWEYFESTCKSWHIKNR